MQLILETALLEFVATDILGPLFMTKGRNWYLLAITNRFSKLVENFPITNILVGTIANALEDNWEQTRDIERISTFRPKSRDVSLRREVFKVGGRIEYGAVNSFSFTTMKTIGTLIKDIKRNLFYRSSTRLFYKFSWLYTSSPECGVISEAKK